MPKTEEPPVAKKKKAKKKATKKKKRAARRKPPRAVKKKLPVDLEESFISRVKDAVVFLQRGDDEPNTSIRSFVQDALEDKLQSITKKHGEIPKRKKIRPRQGRPMKN